ncbi:MAG: hypothetical protein ABSA44_03625 [Bacteroidota bacterium]|jgi:hypothetical protein
MSVLQVRDSLTRSITAFNEKKQALQKSFSNDTEHSESWKQEQKKLKKDKLREEYASNIIDIQNKLLKAENETIQKIGKLKYPASSSISDALKTSGEMQINTAQLFLNRFHSQESIISSIKNALTLGRIDYGFALLEGARETIKPESTGVLSPQNKEFLQSLDSITTAFDSSGNLAELNSELESVPEIAQTAEHFQKFISNENTTASFIPMDVIRSMTQEQVNANLDSVMVSMGCDSNSLTDHVRVKQQLFG